MIFRYVSPPIIVKCVAIWVRPTYSVAFRARERGQVQPRTGFDTWKGSSDSVSTRADACWDHRWTVWGTSGHTPTAVAGLTGHGPGVRAARSGTVRGEAGLSDAIWPASEVSLSKTAGPVGPGTPRFRPDLPARAAPRPHWGRTGPARPGSARLGPEGTGWGRLSGLGLFVTGPRPLTVSAGFGSTLASSSDQRVRLGLRTVSF